MTANTNAAMLAEALRAAQRAIHSMKTEAETAAQGDEQMMLEACEQISNEGLDAWMAIQTALATYHKASPASHIEDDPGKVKQVGAYPPLGGGSLWRDAKGIRGYAVDSGTGPWFTANEMRAYVDADRALRAQAKPTAYEALDGEGQPYIRPARESAWE